MEGHCFASGDTRLLAHRFRGCTIFPTGSCCRTSSRPQSSALQNCGSPGCCSAPGCTTANLSTWPVAAGTFAVLSLMTGSVVERVVPEPLAGNLSGFEREQLEARRVGAAAAVAFGSGALMVSEDPRGWIH